MRGFYLHTEGYMHVSIFYQKKRRRARSGATSIR